MGFKASTGRKPGTTKEVGYNISNGRPLIYNVDGDKDGKRIVLSNDNEQYGVYNEWNADEISLTEDVLARASKGISQQKYFDSKPLIIGMCYCCGCHCWASYLLKVTSYILLATELFSYSYISY